MSEGANVETGAPAPEPTEAGAPALPASEAIAPEAPPEFAAQAQESDSRRDEVRTAPSIGTDGELLAGDEPAVFEHYHLAYAPGSGGERRLARR